MVLPHSRLKIRSMAPVLLVFSQIELLPRLGPISRSVSASRYDGMERWRGENDAATSDRCLSLVIIMETVDVGRPKGRQLSVKAAGRPLRRERRLFPYNDHE